METLASFWSRDPCDLGQSRHESSALWAAPGHSGSHRKSVHRDEPSDFPSGGHERYCTDLISDGSVLKEPGQRVNDSQCVESSAPPVSCAVWTELSPHLQRNKQLHDTLLQREEELARLQEENNKLREFLNSSFVKDLEEKAKRLCVDGRRKRNSLSFIGPISKRVCRNLSAQFCSESEPSEPTLDLWVLKTLGLKDKDTIDTSLDDSNTSSNHYHSPITAHVPQTDCCPNTNQDTDESGFENSSTGFLTPEVYNSTSYSSQTTPEDTYLNDQTPFVEQQDVNHWSSPLQTTISYSPSKRLHFSSISCSTPKKSWMKQNGNAVPIPMGSPCGPGTPHSRPDLAFSMSLSPSSSVKTHSFPQGQAFVRRDPQGRCNFTWVPQDRA